MRPWSAGPHAGPYLDPQTLAKTNEALVRSTSFFLQFSFSRLRLDQIHNAKHMMSRYSKQAAQFKVAIHICIGAHRQRLTDASSNQLSNIQAFVITSDESPKEAALHFAKEQG